MPPWPGFESLGALGETCPRGNPASESVVEGPTQLLLRQQRRAIRESPLERGTWDVVSPDDVLFVEGTRRVERDSADCGAATSFHCDLESILGARLEPPQARRGRVRRDRAFDRQDGGEQPTFPRGPTTDHGVDARSDAFEEATANEMLTLAACQVSLAELRQGDEPVLRCEQVFEVCERCFHRPNRRKTLRHDDRRPALSNFCPPCAENSDNCWWWNPHHALRTLTTVGGEIRTMR